MAAAFVAGGLGGGDVKYLMLTGLALGPMGGLLTVFLSGLMGVIAHIALRLAGRRAEGVLLAPAIAVASVAVAFLMASAH
jgi:Flp pilus assembly protein protease CpaA